MTGNEPKGMVTYIVRLRPDELDALNNGVSIVQRVAGDLIRVEPPEKPMIEVDEPKRQHMQKAEDGGFRP